MDFNATDESIGKWFRQTIDEIIDMLATKQADASSPTGTGEDLGINKFMRSMLLNENREYVIPMSDWPIGDSSGFVFDIHDKMTKTTMKLKQARVVGLDTMTKLDPMNVEGKHTLTNRLSWSQLILEVNIEIKIKASTLPDSIFESANDKEYIENITVRIGLDDVDVAFHFLLAIDEMKLREMQLSQVLHTDQIMSCFIDTLFALNVTGLSVTTTNIHPPTLSGFISNGIDRVVTSLSDVSFEMYESVLIKAMPFFFQRWVREMLNNVIQDLIKDPDNSACPRYSKTGETKAVDFRDLFLEPEVAKAKGAVGDGRYGDLAVTLLKLVEDELLVNDPESAEETPVVNRMVIRPFTKSQSGVEGMLRFNESLISLRQDIIDDNIGSAIADRIEFQVSDFRLSNLDMIHHPIKILDPQNKATTLYNHAHLGERDEYGFRKLENTLVNIPDEHKYLNGTVRMMLELDGDESPLLMKNEFDLSISIPHLEVIAALKAFVIEDSFMTMQLENILNLNCWLTMIPAPELDENGLPVNTTVEPSLSLSQLLMALSDLQVGVNCISCSTKGLYNVSEVFGTIHSSGAINELNKRLISFTANILQGPWLQTQISRLLYHAPKQCPSDPQYIENYEVREYDTLPLPTLSRESVEMIVLSGVILGEVASVVVAESHIDMEMETRDPLSAQNNLSVPSNITLVDLSNMNTTLGNLMDMAISELKSSISNIVEDPDGPNASGQDIEINVQLRSLLLNDDRVLVVDIDSLRFSFSGVTVSFDQVRLIGLDTFKNIDILDIIAPQTILNQFHLEKLRVEVDTSIDMGDNKAVDVMTISVGLTDLRVSLGLLLAINQDLLGNLNLGSLLHMKNILPCLLSSLHQFNITQLAVSIEDLEKPTINGFISQEVKDAISLSIDAVFEKYKTTMIESIPVLFDTTLRHFMNNLVTNYIQEDQNTLCPEPVLTSRIFMNFGDLLLSEKESLRVNGLGNSPYGDVFRSLMKVVEETVLKINPVDGTSTINEKLISGLTKAQSNVSGTLLFAGDLFGTRTKLDIGGLKGVLEFRASDARIENLDTVGQPLKLLQPIEPHVLNNTSTFGVGPRQLRAAVSLILAFEDDDHSLRNEFDMSLDIKSAQIILATLLKIAESPFLKFPVRDVSNIHCWLATIPAPYLDPQGVRSSNSDLNAALTNLIVIMSEIRLHIDCVDCSSPGMKEFASHLSSPEAIRSVTEVTNDILGYVTRLLGGKFLQVQIDRILSEAPVKCPHNLKYNPSVTAVEYRPFSAPEKKNDPVGFLFIIAGVCLCLTCFILLLIISVSRIRQRRHNKWIQTLSKDEMIIIQEQQKIEKQKEDKLNETTTRMISSPTIPLFVRYFMPLVIFGNVGFFLSGHLSLGASVNIRANIAGETINVDKFFEFSMARSTLDMWNAGAKTLAILIGIFSGAWPYIKQFTTLFLWVVSPKWVSVSRRGSIFLWLDRLAKWSIVDIFVLLMSIAAFNISINSPENVDFLIPNLYSIKLFVVPLWGLYANLTAQLISQISSHFIIHYHRKLVATALGEAYGGGRLGINSREDAVNNDMDKDDNLTSTKVLQNQHNRIEALCNHRFDRDGVKKGNNLYVRKWVNYLLICLGTTFLALTVGGCASQSFSMEVLGILGLVVESGQNFKRAFTGYSVFGIVNLLSSQAKELGNPADSIGLGVLSSLLILSVFIVPIVQMALLLCRWFVPLTRYAQTQSFVILEILDAWQYIEVYILSVAVAAWQLGGVSEFMINGFCGSLEDTFASLAYYGIIADEDAQCFRVNARVQGSLWVLLAAAIVLAIMSHFISKAASQQERDLDIKSEKEETGHDRNLYCPSDDYSECEKSFQCNPVDKENNQLAPLIKPVPLLFTDYYRWFLYKDNTFADEKTLKVGVGLPMDEECSKSLSTVPSTIEVSTYSHRIEIN
jgi:hypothetical protein